jgi:hypothetical protein
MKKFNHLSDHLKERNLKLDLEFRNVSTVEGFLARNTERVPIFILLHAIKPEHGLDKEKVNIYPINSLAFRISRKPIVVDPDFKSKMYNPLLQHLIHTENHFNEQMNKIYIGTLARTILV